MKFDRNTVIGFILLALLFFGLFYFNSQEQARNAKNEAIKQAEKDSIAKVNQAKQKIDTTNRQKDTINRQQIQAPVAAGYFQNATKGTEKTETLENDLVRIGFTNKGGQIKWVELKKFKNQDQIN